MSASDLCFVYNNVIDTSSLTASTTDSGSANNLKNDIKGLIHRSTGTSVYYEATWGSNQTIGAIVLPATNASVATTVDVKVNGVDVVTGATPFTYSDIDLWGSAASATANDFYKGRISSGYVILPETYTTVTSLRVTLTRADGNKFDISRLVAGRVWRPTRQASNGIKFEKQDNSQITRTNSGNVVLDRGYTYDTMSFDIKYMDETDRTELFKILKMVGSNKFIFVTIFPSLANRLSQDYSIYGRIISSPINYDYYNFYTNTVSIESW